MPGTSFHDMGEVIRLTGARVALDESRTARIDLHLCRGRILPFDSKRAPAREFDLSGHLLLPGLINAHDHLEFSLFPRLGKGPWPNALAWAAEIHRPDIAPVKEHRAVPRPVRLAWGAIRNLLSGVTTVAHHNPYEAIFSSRGFPVRVVRKFAWAHSLDFSPDVVTLRRRTPANWPFVIHAAEGTDEKAERELTTLDELGLLDSQSVLVHATAATEAQIQKIRKRNASVVWCPSSNLYTLGRTISADTLRPLRSTSLGTDSALTAAGDLVDELDVARGQCGLSASEAYVFVTVNPARALQLRRGEGCIRENGVADLLAVRDTGQTPADALTNLRPELVLKAGRVMLVSERFSRQRGVPGSKTGMHWLDVKTRGRALVRANVPDLYASAREFLGAEIRLAGKLVAV
jgi:cytosine/adenosine deaminase-related metal-dependent hydrolase